jgi:hypothetical protein
MIGVGLGIALAAGDAFGWAPAFGLMIGLVACPVVPVFPVFAVPDAPELPVVEVCADKV